MRKETVTQENIQFRIHPRVFAALGEDLVTNDVVAILELVKNAYDAFATRVDVIFGESETLGKYLDITDNGVGMDRNTIANAWCVVATPNRKDNPLAVHGRKTRRVAGEKGLGRLATARLGKKLRMLTQSDGEPCWLVTVDWSELSREKSLADCFVRCRPYSKESPFKISGTRVRIVDLNSDWDRDSVADLEENLTRLVSPFADLEDFTIHLTAAESEIDEKLTTKVSAPEFLRHPPYAIRGHVTGKGDVKARYEFNSARGERKQQRQVHIAWSEILKNSTLADKLDLDSPGCGPFSFEIRAWDLGSDGTRDIAEHFDISKSSIRKAIGAHKGISVYRDGILVLPKTEENRDWLGLDGRRISKVGTRLGTSQIVGYVSVSADANPEIEDTSNREGLARNAAVSAFQEILRAVMNVLEKNRDEDRLKPGDRVMLHALLDDVSAEELVEEVSAMAEDGGSAEEALVRVRNFNNQLLLVREALKKRLIYYSRLATVGTIAQMLVHEIRNRTTAISYFLKSVRVEKWGTENEKEFKNRLALAEQSVSRLEKLADTFAPLASRGFKRGHRDAILEESVSRCLDLLEQDLSHAGVSVQRSLASKTRVAVDPGELDTVILNLLDNAIYWLRDIKSKRIIDISARRLQNGNRVRVTVGDSGPGVAPDDVDKIFLPGVTRKIGGIGMGLTVTAELISDYGGTLALEPKGKLGGATFVFDVPTKI